MLPLADTGPLIRPICPKSILVAVMLQSDTTVARTVKVHDVPCGILDEQAGGVDT
ncbi:hypothetical protein D3C84_1096070 [compost metagenome]